jgi:hypothetical protein
MTNLLFASSLLLALPGAVKSQDMKLEYHGAGWLKIGRVEHSFSLPNNGNDYEKNWVGNAGGLISATAKIDENWEGAFGVGTIMVHLARGSRGQAKKWYPFWVPFVDEARFTRTSHLFSESDNLGLTFGSFHHQYNGDAKNLGNYLLHGYVYPGTIQSHLSDPLGVPLNLSGVKASYSAGFFSNDLMAFLETDEKPLYDISIADVATFKFHPAFEFGLGVNFYRLVPMVSERTSPGKDCDPEFLNTYAKRGQDNACFIIEKDTAGVPTDTILGSFAGIKPMARFRLDPKALFSFDAELFGKDDFVLYGEAAILGVKDYPQVYDNILRRIPVMLGLNLPGFNFLNASIEVEYYANKLSGDNIAARNGSWISVVDDPLINTKRDDWKWSLNASKVLFGNMIFLAQVANDHLRLGGNHDDDTGVEATRTPEDWYWQTKLAYFF